MHKPVARSLAALVTLVVVLTMLALQLPSRQVAVVRVRARVVDVDAVEIHLEALTNFLAISSSDDPAQLQTAALEAFHG